MAMVFTVPTIRATLGLGRGPAFPAPPEADLAERVAYPSAARADDGPTTGRRKRKTCPENAKYPNPDAL
ncbi:hypothetical protein [Streptomyces sp. NPDC052042]|uniref:hypothetical protein n=1 Tax=Streptomyces sp. NPDC052042 TaxID=3365683 RepID=UPI0037D81F66